ncbi:hypothetical protein ILYODFUR_038341 [Ilyodon furcidens]|uniref:Uncharacterized protein n=1 Tax=Ilyodon furcidens TaxID=33524 RepID=A0ABV0VL07_9TELE
MHLTMEYALQIKKAMLAFQVHKSVLFKEMIAEIEKKLFVGSADKKGKNPLYCLNSLDNSYFRTAGEVMAVSIAQSGPLPNFMRE